MPQPQIEVLSELVDLLVECADPRARERILVTALRDKGWSQSAALFHAQPRAASSDAWTESIALGPADLLLDGETVRAVYCGELPDELPLSKRVLFGANSQVRMALVLGGFGGEEHELDLLEATFQVLAAVGEGDRVTSSVDPTLLDLVHGALPSSPVVTDRQNTPVANELSRLLQQMGGTESLLQGGLGPLAEEDQAHFGALLESTCEEAAGLFGQALERAAAELSHVGDVCVAARLDQLCEQGAWILAQRKIELVVHSAPAARMFTLPVASEALDALLEEVLGRLFERLRRLRAGGGRVDLELERVNARQLTLRVWTQLRRGRELPKGPAVMVPDSLLEGCCAKLVAHDDAQPGACIELHFERPGSAAA